MKRRRTARSLKTMRFCIAALRRNKRALPYGRIKTLYLKTDLEVLVQPCDQEVMPGQNVEFNAVANDQPKAFLPVAGEPDKGTTWSDIPGATASQYTFTTQNDEPKTAISTAAGWKNRIYKVLRLCFHYSARIPWRTRTMRLRLFAACDA